MRQPVTDSVAEGNPERRALHRLSGARRPQALEQTYTLPVLSGRAVFVYKHSASGHQY